MPTKKTSTSTSVILLLLLGFLHAVVLVQAFTSSLPTPAKATTTESTQARQQQSIIRPSDTNSKSNYVNPLLSSATTVSSWYRSVTTVSSSLRAISSLSSSASTVEETAEVSSDSSSNNNGLPEFGPDGLYHITTQDEYK